ncbi:unnamed protein product [Microthlaspi erraticum]|uniref:Reverse transcriptase zinc-binding domain-containing protein n=1 Tax=Microthlaspi erraticum TaxID=1685480 RepID=A0A6D2IYU6_9BRAS|nr:unnamed protein product [Microthlaspi erraticum]
MRMFFLWRNSHNSQPGYFSSSETWDSIHPSPPTIPWTQSVWFKDRIPKHAFILWLAMRDRLSTRDRLRSWGLNVPTNCLLCNAVPETRNHLLVECAYSTEVWASFFAHSDFTLPSSIDERVLWCEAPTANGKVNSICKLLVQAIVYMVWRERNSRLHSSVLKPSHVLIREIQLILRAKLFSLDRAPNYLASSSSSTNHCSFLHNWFQYFQI